ncbi:MAG: amino acid adenylation domain-containing protein [Opitutaceae bacterium]|nr:amino acid adenylation domain-containing protein [Opitutaceae bacterium]
MNPHEPQESIAIIGMAGRFPQAGNLEEFWHNLRHGVEGVSFFADEQVQWLPIEHAPDLKDPRYVKARAVLEKPEWFDAPFFGFSPQEARVMDPQHRVFLECCWEALEHAGCNPETHAGLIGVFAGASMNTYLFTNLLTNRDLVANTGIFPTMIANDGDFVPTRVSYKLNLRGPSINVQTACSTSLVAVCLAAQSLLSYRCDVALAGGVSITFPPNRGQHHLEGGILSPDGHCRAFDAKAAGTVLGDGAGVVVLKRLSEAMADGDNICAVIKGTAINNDGAVKIGYTAPSIDGQAEVIAMAHAEAGFAPETISYVEAHGTGTPLGDPIEIAGLTKAFGLQGERGQFCALGSVKSNIGHLDIGAGVAGLIKTVLALQHGEIPPSLHFERPNPKIDFEHSPFFVNHALRAWPRGEQPRRAGVSSFGIGGTNSHVALEEAPAPEPVSPARPRHLLLLSARTATALEAATDNLARHLERNSDANLADVAFTLQTGRKVFAHRRAVVCDDAADAVEVLTARDAKRIASGGSDAEAPTVAFMFPGQGAQAVNMARELYETEPTFRAAIDRSCELLEPRLGLDLRAVLFPAPEQAEAAAKQLTETRLTQPALFAIEHAMAQRWMQWGIKPAAMIGHSLGEYVAACLAGVFSLEDALALVAERARLMQAQPAGAMLAVRVAPEKIREFLGSNLALAAVNAPGLCVVSGPFGAIDALEQRLAASVIPFKRLATSHAFHSAMMEPALRPLAEFIAKLKLNAPAIPWVSNVTGTWITPAEATRAEYWTTHVRQTVKFADGVAELVKGGSRILLEVGPGATLAGLARQHPATGGGATTILASLGRTRDNASDRSSILHTLGELWIAGSRIDWRGGLYRDERRRIVPLPTYPFERKRHWVEPGMTFDLGSKPAPINGPAPTMALEAETIPAAVNGAVLNGAAPPVPAAAPNAITATTVGALKEIFQQLSGIDLAEAGPDESFYQLGFDSLFLTQASVAVGKRFGLDITFRQLREDLITFGKLAAHIEQRTVLAPGAASQATNVATATNPTIVTVAGADVAAPITNGREPGAGLTVDTTRPSAAALPTDHMRASTVTLAAQCIPLTDAQREIWYACQLGAAASAAYNESITLQLDGPLSVAALRRAVESLVARHDALRTTFSPLGDGQRIAAGAPIELTCHDFSSAAPADRRKLAAQCADEQVNATFDLVNGPLFRARLIQLAPDSHLLVLAVHHLVCDGWSLAVLQHELGEFYSAEVQGRPAVLPEAQSFSQYAGRQQRAHRTPAYLAAEEFWKRQFPEHVPILELPTDRPRPVQRTFAGGFFLRTLAPDVTAGVKRLCGDRGCTMFTALLAGFNVLLHRLATQDDVIVGVPAAGQVMGGLGNAVGHFANLLPIRSRLKDDARFSDYLTEMRQHVGDALEHWCYPFGTLLQQIDFVRQPSRVPVAPVVFNTVRHRGVLDFAGLAVTPTNNPKRFVNFDLNFNFALADESVMLGCYYSSELYDDATMARWFGHFETLLRGIVANSESPVASLPLLTGAERHQLLVEWNNTTLEYDRSACIHQRFEEQVRRHPNAVAVVGHDQRWTYRELNARADTIARHLRGRGIGPDHLVGIFLQRSPPLVAAMLGILKAGGAYVPLDISHPKDRLSFVARDTGMRVVLTERSLTAFLPDGEWDAVAIDDEAQLASPSSAAATGSPTADNLAYVIYTSGSTGRPKGVCVPHRGVAALVAWSAQHYRADELAGVLFATSASFDVAVFESLVPLCLGGKIIVASSILELGSLRARNEVTLISGVPSAVAELVRGNLVPTSVHTINVAGEPCPQSLVEALYALPQIERVFDVYGPTETTVYSTGGKRVRGGRATIGRPLANEQAYILDRRMQPVPIGVRGELFIGGDKVARGYLNLPQLTQERFVEAPFLPGRRLYRTGDGARFSADGTIEFLGRLDYQVKIRGYRIELGEIEAALAGHPSVSECVVVARGEATNARLLGYVVAAAGGSIEVAALRAHLGQKLPEYMVPVVLTVLDELPRTTSGKINRKALPDPEVTTESAPFVAPRSTAEELMADIWRDVLGLKQIGVHDSFFELGGHSLLAAQVITRVQDALNVDLTMQQFFASPTIAGFAPVVEVALLEQINADPAAVSESGASRQPMTAKE